MGLNVARGWRTLLKFNSTCRGASRRVSGRGVAYLCACVLRGYELCGRSAEKPFLAWRPLSVLRRKYARSTIPAASLGASCAGKLDTPLACLLGLSPATAEAA